MSTADRLHDELSPGAFPRRWLGAGRRSRALSEFASVSELSDHLLRDIGLCRDPHLGCRRYLMHL